MNICLVCGKDVLNFYCSLSCSNRSRFAKNEVKYNLNPISCRGCTGFVPYAKRFENVFCTHSCAATFNNKRKKRKQHGCKVCGAPTRLYKNDFRCRSCYMADFIKEFGERIIEEFKSTYARHRYQKIRSHAHRVANYAELIKACNVCGYDRHVELAHKISIGSFSKESKLREVNSVDNLVYLCPNHHWELDVGILDLSDSRTMAVRDLAKV